MGISLFGVLEMERQCPVDDIANFEGVAYKYYVFTDISIAIQCGMARFITVAPIPAAYREFPRLRASGPRDGNGKVRCWFIYNGAVTFDYQKLKDPKVRIRVDQLTEDQKRLSTTMIYPPDILRRMLESGWLPKDEI